VIAPRTDSLLTRLLMFEAVPYSSASIRLIRAIWSFGGMIREIMLVPLLKYGGYNDSHPIDRHGYTISDHITQFLFVGSFQAAGRQVS